MNQQTCNRDWLDAFLKNDLNQREEQMLTSHLDECSDCREELESLAAEQSVWREASNLLSGGIPHSTAAICESRSGTVHSPQIALVLQQLSPTDDPESLGRIGGYEVTGVVGAGGMGVVLKAHDRSLDRIVAIKVMSPHLASSGSARKRFAREAKAAAAVLHPNVIAIHSVASEDANPYLVMPFVRGASLQKRIDSQGPLPLKDTLRIGAQIAAGLAAAHEQGLVHRDIKPANILLEEGVERVTITDFGLARAVDDASMTCSGVIAGTPQYMSPEQARGEPIDARSDLFSLGGVLYAMCTGRSPFRAETTYGVLHRIANDKPTPVCEVNTDVPVWLEHVIERLMAKRPEDRFESAAQVAELLEGCLAHVQQPAAMPLPEAVAALGPKKTRRPPIGKFIAAAAFAFALVFAGVVIVLELNKGTLTVKSDVEDIRVRITRGDELIDELTVTKTGQSVRVAAGQYNVEVIGETDDLTVENGQVTLHRAGVEVVRIVHNANNGAATGTAAKNLSTFQWLDKLQGNWNVVQQHFDNGVPKRNLYSATVLGNRMEIAPADGQHSMMFDLVLGEVGPPQQIDLKPVVSDLERQEMLQALGDIDEPPPEAILNPIFNGIIDLDGTKLRICNHEKPNSPRPIQFTDSAERVIWNFTRPVAGSSANVSSSKSPPEYPPVKIVVHDEEGKPLEGVKVSLRQLAKEPGGQVLEINETSKTSGLSVNRNLPYGHYELSAKTADGWYLTGLRSRLNVEFERGVDAILVAPTPGKTLKLVISSDLATSPEKISGLRFGGLTEDRWTQYAPEPEGSDSFKEQEFSSFPTITNGIEYVGAEIGLHITRNISQPAPSMQQMNTSWFWSRPPNSKVSIRYLIANGQARSFNEGNTPQNESLKRLPVEGSEFFKLPSPKYYVGAELLKLREPTQLPLELDIPAGDVRVKIGRFLGKPSASVMAALNWQPREQQPELWLQAYIAPDSAWVERLINMDWINSPFRSGGSVGFTAIWRDQALQPGERLEIPLGMKQYQKTSLKTKAAKIIVDVYGGNRVLGQNNAKYVKLVQALDAIDDVQVNFREAGPGSEIALAIVRDPNGLINQDANSTGKTSARRDAISKALAQVPTVRWEEGVLGVSLHRNQSPAEQLFQDAMEEATADEAYQAMEKLLANAKMDWKSTESYIATAATRMTSNIEFAKHVLDHFKRACAGGESTYQARRNLLAVLTRAFQTWGQSRWSTAPASTQQHSKPSETRPQEILDFELSALEAIVSYGHKATRSDIVDFVRAARALHHPDAKPFLQDVALNPQNPSADPYTPPVTNRTNTNLHVWRDNLGGTWPDARFVAAVGLAELGDQTAIEWLLDKAKPNDFGLDESINLSHHERDGSGSLRESCRCALIDLFGQPKDSTVAQLSDWWTSNRSQVTPRVVRLKSDFATKTVTPLERILANARSVVEAYVASAISGDVAQASALAKNSPADPKRIRELPEFLNVQRLKIETVYINDPTKPTQALATSVAIKLEEKHKNPDGRRDGFLVFTLELTDEKWFVIDIDFQTESGAEKELNKFLKANPNSIGIPPQS